MNLTEKVLETLTELQTTLERDRSTLQAALVQTDRTNRLRGARVLPAPGDSGRPLLWAAPGRLVGWSLTAVGGPVLVRLTDSRDGDGYPVASIAIAADGASQQWFGPGGVSFGEALFATVTGAGALAGAFYLGAVD